MLIAKIIIIIALQATSSAALSCAKLALRSTAPQRQTA
ncbi:hypothetical protein RNAN_1129 [Rheinheimera nanhaiensis E407-8]|uniref:Uncharacterized protein n=1 Tax=Rheinheimera nanhaiensis E407-8 TaxID=562729 RepID=I1DVT0_9GAMM|nr:hypothetical protein RNAN_1129 [Rheinheimera nanhaiensis E407-8]